MLLSSGRKKENRLVATNILLLLSLSDRKDSASR